MSIDLADMEHLVAVVTQLAENQATMQQVLESQVVGRGSDSELIKEFRSLNSFDFEGSVVLGEAEN